MRVKARKVKEDGQQSTPTHTNVAILAETYVQRKRIVENTGRWRDMIADFNTSRWTQ